MKKLLCALLATLLALSAFGLSAFAEGEATPGTVLYHQPFDSSEALNDITVLLNKNSDYEGKVEDGKFIATAPTATGSQVLLQMYDLKDDNVSAYTIVMKAGIIENLDTSSDKTLIGPAYAVKDGKNYSNLALRGCGNYDFTRYSGGKWVSNKTYPDGGSSRNGKKYSVAVDTTYELAMVITAEGRVRCYLNGILQPDDVPLHADGTGVGIYLRYGTFFVDDLIVYAGEYVPANYPELDSPASTEDDLATALPTVGIFGAQRSTVAEGSYSLRLIAQINGSDYTGAGFKVTATSGGQSGEEQILACTGAYTSILAEATDGTLQAKAAANGCYLIAVVIENIPVEGFENITFTVTPYVADGEGETTGKTAAFTLQNAELVSAAWVN